MSKIVCVHSFRHGTGKSNVVANLAAIIASCGQRAGIIDTDIPSPGLHVLFGLESEKINATLNDYLWGSAALADIAYDVSDTANTSGSRRWPAAATSQPLGGIYLIPGSLKASEIPRVWGGGYNVELLSDSFELLLSELRLDYLFIDTRAGLDRETLMAIALCDVLVLVLRLDRQDFQGTALMVELARKLHVPHIYLAVNEVLPAYDFDAVRQQMETTYSVPVAGILPFSETLVELASSDLFCLQYPNHLFTQQLRAIAEKITCCKASQMRPEIVLAPPSENPDREEGGLRMFDFLMQHNSERQLAKWILQQRKSVTLAEVAAHTGTEEIAVRTMLDTLVEQGCLLELEMAGERRYRPRLAPKKGRQLCKYIWEKLEEAD